MTVTDGDFPKEPELLGRIQKFSTSSGQAMLASTLVVLMVTLGLASAAGFWSGHTVTSYDPIHMDIRARQQPPCGTHWLGTDKIGRNSQARVIAGARISLSVSACVLAVTGTVGTIKGRVAGYFGGLVDEVLMRLTDLFLAFPALILAAGIAASFGGGMIPTTIALAAVFWPWYARLIRARVLSLKQQDYVAAARAMGASNLRLIFVTLLPMVWLLVIVQATTDVGFVILSASGLSFLGLGAQLPTPEWGVMIFENLTNQPAAWWLAVFPGSAIALTTIGFNLLGDSLRDHLDPSLGTAEAGV